MLREGSPARATEPRGALRPWLLGVLGMLLSLGVALAVDASFFSHAMTVAWHATATDGARFEMTRTVEHRLTFPNQHRAVARYIENWNFDRLEPPMTPPIDAVVLAHLEVPRGSNVFIGSTGSGVREVRVDGQLIDADGITPGPHWLEVSWPRFRRATRASCMAIGARTTRPVRISNSPRQAAWS